MNPNQSSVRRRKVLNFMLKVNSLFFSRKTSIHINYHHQHLLDLNMVRHAFCVPALVSSFIACVLLLLCTVSTPTTFHTSTPFEFVRASNLGNITDGTNNTSNHNRLLEGIKVRDIIVYIRKTGAHLTIHLPFTARIMGLLH